MTDADSRGRNAETPIEIPLQGWRGIALRVKDQFREDHVTLTAAGVAFFGFAALVPTLAAAVSIYGLVADPSDIASVSDRIRGAAPPAVADLVEQQLESVTGSSPNALGLAMLVSIVLALWSASSGMTHLMEATNIAYSEDTDDRPFWKRRLLAIGFIFGFVAFAITAELTLRVLSGPLVVVALALIVAGGIAVFAALYRYAPDRDDPEWKWVTPGALFAVVGWLVVSVGFRFYVARFSSYNETYGALGAILIVLIWLYLSAAVVIVGAEINSEVERQTAHDSTVGPSEPLGQRGAHAADDVAPSPD